LYFAIDELLRGRGTLLAQHFGTQLNIRAVRSADPDLDYESPGVVEFGLGHYLRR
jgi:hypothetical protein